MIARTIAQDKLEQAKNLHKVLKTIKRKGLDPDQVFFGQQEPDLLSEDILSEPFYKHRNKEVK